MKNVTLKIMIDATPSREEAAQRIVAKQLQRSGVNKDWPNTDLAYSRSICQDCESPIWKPGGSQSWLCEPCQTKEDLRREEERHHANIQMQLDKERLTQLRGERLEQPTRKPPVEKPRLTAVDGDPGSVLVSLIERGFKKVRDPLLDLIDEANERHQDD